MRIPFFLLGFRGGDVFCLEDEEASRSQERELFVLWRCVMLRQGPKLEWRDNEYLANHVSDASTQAVSN